MNFDTGCACGKGAIVQCLRVYDAKAVTSWLYPSESFKGWTCDTGLERMGSDERGTGGLLLTISHNGNLNHRPSS